MSKTASQASSKPFTKTGGSRILGFKKEGLIKTFFGSNALLAIIFLLAICLFLIREAIEFFPDYHKNLTLYRQSGQEFVTLLEDQYKAQKDVYKFVDQAYNIERTEAGQAELAQLTIFNQARGKLLDDIEDECDEWDEANDLLEDAQDELEDAEAGEEGSAQTALEQAKSVELTKRSVWSEALNAGMSQLEKPATISDELWVEVLKALRAMKPDEDMSPYAQELLKAVDGRVAPFREVRNTLKNSINPLEEMWLELRDAASGAKDAGIAFKSAPERKAALEEGARNQKDPKKAAVMKAQAAAVVIKEPDWDEVNKTFYAIVPEATQVTNQLLEALEAARKNLPQPESLNSELAASKLQQALDTIEQTNTIIIDRRETMQTWRHDTEYSFFRSSMGFFLGKKWVTNSSWQDFYGLLPLFSGSLLISVVALLLAVPFSVAAAIYTNQLANRWEAKFIKPSIEFIQAIPSVVLGLFGILILGETLRTISNIEALSWIPGFPMQERLNVLNAGMLLALMAVPTVFTLAEDAINNVPRAFRDASYALGATKLQTVLRVIVPTAISGIVAAILLGFGRVIGETMVVLLVAGNKIAIPDFAEGLGVLTQPVHTMTGLIAQETGEVNQGSLHWRALFMVGLILFMISLVINYVSQLLIRRFQLKS